MVQITRHHHTISKTCSSQFFFFFRSDSTLTHLIITNPYRTHFQYEHSFYILTQYIDNRCSFFAYKQIVVQSWTLPDILVKIQFSQPDQKQNRYVMNYLNLFKRLSVSQFNKPLLNIFAKAQMLPLNFQQNHIQTEPFSRERMQKRSFKLLDRI